MVFWEKKKIIIFFNRCLKKKNESPKHKENIFIFVQKIDLGGILTLVSKVKEVSTISETTGKVVGFVRNIKNINEIYP